LLVTNVITALRVLWCWRISIEQPRSARVGDDAVASAPLCRIERGVGTT
jgi:hypothetical protein